MQIGLEQQDWGPRPGSGIGWHDNAGPHARMHAWQQGMAARHGSKAWGKALQSRRGVGVCFVCLSVCVCLVGGESREVGQTGCTGSSQHYMTKLRLDRWMGWVGVFIVLAGRRRRPHGRGNDSLHRSGLYLEPKGSAETIRTVLRHGAAGRQTVSCAGVGSRAVAEKR